MLVRLESRVTDVGIQTHLELQLGTSIITPKTFHLTVVVNLLNVNIISRTALIRNRISRRVCT